MPRSGGGLPRDACGNAIGEGLRPFLLLSPCATFSAFSLSFLSLSCLQWNSRTRLRVTGNALEELARHSRPTIWPDNLAGGLWPGTLARHLARRIGLPNVDAP
jgi:hypothetical protein